MCFIIALPQSESLSHSVALRVQRKQKATRALPWLSTASLTYIITANYTNTKVANMFFSASLSSRENECKQRPLTFVFCPREMPKRNAKFACSPDIFSSLSCCECTHTWWNNHLHNKRWFSVCLFRQLNNDVLTFSLYPGKKYTRQSLLCPQVLRNIVHNIALSCLQCVITMCVFLSDVGSQSTYSTFWLPQKLDAFFYIYFHSSIWFKYTTLETRANFKRRAQKICSLSM